MTFLIWNKNIEKSFIGTDSFWANTCLKMERDERDF